MAEMDDLKSTKALEIRLDGDLVENHKVNLRVLGSIAPNFQRSFDKAVFLDLEGKFKRGSSLPKKDRYRSDFYIDGIREGSLILTLKSRISNSALGRYKWMIKEPFNKAAQGEAAIHGELQEKALQARALAGEFEDRTQKDVIREAEASHEDFARAAALSDLHHALDKVRGGGDNFLSIDFIRPGMEESFNFDRQQAIRFGKIVYKNYLTKPAIYRGKIRGTREKSNTDGYGYEADLLSSYTGQNMTVYVKLEEQIKELADHAYGDEIAFWASPLQRYGGFDPYNGSVVYLGMYQQ